MSSANFLNAEKQYSAPTFVITADPSELNDGARVVDSIRFLGNGTYDETLSQTILATDTDYTPLFLSGISEEDYMRIKSEGTNTNYDQLALVEYKLKVLGNSMDTFRIRFATYDASLNLVRGYDPILYDPSNNPNQSAILGALNLRGFSVEYDDEAVYGFVEISGDGTGSLHVGFDYANSDLQNSIDTSRDVEAPTTLNLWRMDTDDIIRDISGVEAEIHALQADVASLQAGESNIDASLNALEAGKVAKVGDTMTGTLTLANPSAYPTGWRSALKIGSGLASCIEANDPSDDFCPAIGFYGSESAGQKNIYFWTGADSGNQRNPGTAWVDYTAVFGDSFAIRTNLEMGRGNALPGNIIMDSQNVKGMGEPVDPSDATTKNYVDVADASLQSQITANANGVNARLPLAGGTMTGQLSMGGSRITNVGAPIQGSDVASKGYVDANAGDANLQQVLSRGNDAGGQPITNAGYITGGDLNATQDANITRDVNVGTGNVNISIGNLSVPLGSITANSSIATQPLETIQYLEVAGGSTINHLPNSSTNRIIYITSPGDCIFQLSGSYPNGYRVRVRNDSGTGAPSIRFLDGTGSSLFSGNDIGGQNATFQRWAELGYDGSKWRILCAGSDGFAPVR